MRPLWTAGDLAANQTQARQQVNSAEPLPAAISCIPVWSGSAEVYTNVVDLYVSYLRKKLDRKGEPFRIRTVHGAGYTFDPRPGR